MRRIHLVSSVEPNGVTWLLNLLLALNLKIEQNLDSSMWEDDKNGNLILKNHHLSLLAYMPELHRSNSFRFHQDIVFSWSHNWPHEFSEIKFDKIFLFVRDPRDALFSRYRRILYSDSYANFLEIPNLPYLLNPIDSWKWFHRIWLSRPDISILRFEDFKKDPFESSSKFLQLLNLKFTQSDLEYAIESSSIENAKAANDAYQKMEIVEKLPYSVINSGKQQEWQLDESREELSDTIVKKCSVEMCKLGYIHRPLRTKGANLQKDTNWPEYLDLTAEPYENIFKYFDKSENSLNWKKIIPVISKSISEKEFHLTAQLLVVCINRAHSLKGVYKLITSRLLSFLLIITQAIIRATGLRRRLIGFVNFRFIKRRKW